MHKKRILVTGASGFLGWNLLQARWAGWGWVGTSHRHDPQLPELNIIRADLNDPGAVSHLLDRVRPDGILHTAALAALDACETDPDGSRRINSDVPAALAAHCAARGIKLVFTSSDMVFDGRRAPYAENSPRHPINHYGCQKAEAENRVLAACPDAAVCRLPLLFGPAGPCAHNFLPEWMSRLERGERLTLFTDECRSPVSVSVAIAGLRLAMEQDVRGLLHLGGRERISRYDFGRLLCDVGGWDPGLLTPAQQADLSFTAPRPSDTTLDSRRAWGLGYDPPPLLEQLTMTMAEGRVV